MHCLVGLCDMQARIGICLLCCCPSLQGSDFSIVFVARIPCDYIRYWVVYFSKALYAYQYADLQYRFMILLRSEKCFIVGSLLFLFFLNSGKIYVYHFRQVYVVIVQVYTSVGFNNVFTIIDLSHYISDNSLGLYYCRYI